MELFQKVELFLLFVAFILLLIVLVFGNNAISGFFVSEPELKMPSNFISKYDIKADEKSVTFLIDNAVLSNYEDSESMLPVLGKGATGVGKKPVSPGEINVGDIVSFWQDEKLIVHRVIGKGEDDLGVYFITKGDNNSLNDGKIRFSQIDSVLVAIIY